MEVRELKSHEFNERLLPIFAAVLREAAHPFEPNYFFSHWRHLMEMGFARAWETDRAVLGAIFTRNNFSGELMAAVSFWFCHPDVRGTGVAGPLMQTFETVAKENGCTVLYSAAHVVRHDDRREGYLKHGYAPIEVTFRKRIA